MLSAVNGGSLLSTLTSVIYPPYGIYYATGEHANSPALQFYSVQNYSHDGAANISTAPVETVNNTAGSYSSYNKVAQPARISMRVMLEGSTAFSGAIPSIPSLDLNNKSLVVTSRTEMINKLEAMRFSADLYNIETPDRVYANYDLVSYSFPIRPNSGVTLLIVDLVFQEVRTTATIQSMLNSVENSTTTAKAPTTRVE